MKKMLIVAFLIVLTSVGQGLANYCHCQGNADTQYTECYIEGNTKDICTNNCSRYGGYAGDIENWSGWTYAFNNAPSCQKLSS